MKIILYTCASYDPDAQTTDLWSRVYGYEAGEGVHPLTTTVRDVHRCIMWEKADTYVRTEVLKAAQRWVDLVENVRDPF